MTAGTALPLPVGSPHALRTNFLTDRLHMSLVDLTVEIPSTTVPPEKKRPARWATFEFKIYWTVLAVMLPIMAWIPISLSSRECYLSLNIVAAQQSSFKSKLRCLCVQALRWLDMGPSNREFFS